ncbi:hypothetical protein BB560_004634 [Smittium megazygosporum]|uniref:Uncharacterized protein n=1 Tax=Smittium megazygosporum TaxID=133381 RepID=A0A2T9Z8V0_9FUNG|nr:hypothetical protein BB560_004634 [Smittium megazygosporum]
MNIFGTSIPFRLLGRFSRTVLLCMVFVTIFLFYNSIHKSEKRRLLRDDINSTNNMQGSCILRGMKKVQNASNRKFSGIGGYRYANIGVKSSKYQQELEFNANLELEKEKNVNSMLRKQLEEKGLELDILTEKNKIQMKQQHTISANSKHSISILNSINTESWKLTNEELKNLTYFDKRNKVNMLPTPIMKHNHSIIELFDDYLITLPIADYESIQWVKNIYSDMNIKIICDGNDSREDCDIKLGQKYDYDTLYKKTYFSMDYICKNIYNKTDKKIKFFAKMDFDVMVNKNYLYSVIKFISDNSHLRIYFGNSSPLRDREGVEMNGQFYAISGALLDEYCSCNIPEAQGNGEDLWFALALHKCIADKYPPEERRMFYIENSRDWVKHAKYIDKGVQLVLGRHALKDKKK